PERAPRAWEPLQAGQPCAASNGGGSVDLWPHGSRTMKRHCRTRAHPMRVVGARARRRQSVLCLAGSSLLMLGLMQLLAVPSSAATQSTVSLTFDGNNISQYNLGYLQALQPHGAHGTFFVNSGTVSGGANFVSWAQLGTIAAAGNDIGGKSVNATNLTTDPNPTAQVCNDRTAILQHGLTPVGFAYPGGTNNAAVQAIVKNCQYGNARTAGGVSPGGAVEALPPGNWFATKAYAPSAVTLANMQAVV